MTALDLVLVVVLLLSAGAGYRIGFLVRAAGLGGFVAGLALSIGVVPLVTRLLDPRTLGGALTTTALTVVVCVLSGMVAMQMWAWRLRQQISDERLRLLDRVGGGTIGVVGALVFVWITAPLAGMIPGPAAVAVRQSVVVRTVTEIMPTDANPLAALQTLLADSRFPEVFTDLAGVQSDGPPPVAPGLPRTVTDTATASALKIEVDGCGARYVGSGWVVDRDLVVTSAHVVAGADAVVVRRPDGTRLDAVPVVLDDDRDLALLAVADLDLAPLPRGTATTGEAAVTLGHPRGQDALRVAPARVDERIAATGRDIYGLDETRRSILVLAATLQQGDSGAAVVDADGAVIGTVFAISPSDPDTAYALSDTELQAVLDAPRTPGDTGRCS